MNTSSEKMHLASVTNVISTLTANGKEVMGPDILLWHYPANDIVNGSQLMVTRNQFCVLQSFGTILNVYKTGLYVVQSPDRAPFDSLQLSFSGRPISWQYEALYINRAKLALNVSGVTYSREMAEADYSVDYSIYVATCEDAIQLVQRIPHLGHTLTIGDINKYTRSVIEGTVNQLVQVTPLDLLQGLQMMHDLSQLVHQRLRPFLFAYGITLDTVKVLVTSRQENMKGAVAPKVSSLSELDAVHYYTAMQENSTEHRLKEQYEELEQNLYMIWQEMLDRYTIDLIALQTELDDRRSNISLLMDVHIAHLLELSHAISNNLQANSAIQDTRMARSQTTALHQNTVMNLPHS